MFFLICSVSGSASFAQTLLANPGSPGWECWNGYGCAPQPNYDVTANTTTGDMYLLKHEYTPIDPFTGTYDDKLIRFSNSGTRLSDRILRNDSYVRILAGNGNGVFVLSLHNDSVYVTRFNQNSLATVWSTCIHYSGSAEAFDITHAFGYLYFGFNDSSGMNLFKLNKSTGTLISSVNYNTSFVSDEHALEIKASSNAIYIAGYVSEPGTTHGDGIWLAKFGSNLVFNWERLYNHNKIVGFNSDRASHLRIVNDTIYVCGTITRNSGNVDATLIKYSPGGTLVWQKFVNKGNQDAFVDCAIDNSNGDVYLLQNAFTNLSKIFVTRFNASGIQQWSKGYASSDTTGQGTIGYCIHADPNPGGNGCEIYVTGQREDYGGDGHGHTNGYNDLAFKYNRSGVRSVFYYGDVGSGPGGLAPYRAIKKSVYYQFSSGAPRLIMIGDGDYTALYPGMYGWTLMLWDISSTARFANEVINNPASTPNSVNLRLWPNPANDHFILNADEEIQEVKIFNPQGQPVRIQPCHGFELEINVQELSKGMYIVRSLIGNQPYYTRLIVR